MTTTTADPQNLLGRYQCMLGFNGQRNSVTTKSENKEVPALDDK